VAQGLELLGRDCLKMIQTSYLHWIDTVPITGSAAPSPPFPNTAKKTSAFAPTGMAIHPDMRVPELAIAAVSADPAELSPMVVKELSSVEYLI
jgi:hypothetical protein